MTKVPNRMPQKKLPSKTNPPVMKTIDMMTRGTSNTKILNELEKNSKYTNQGFDLEDIAKTIENDMYRKSNNNKVTYIRHLDKIVDDISAVSYEIENCINNHENTSNSGTTNKVTNAFEITNPTTNKVNNPFADMPSADESIFSNNAPNKISKTFEKPNKIGENKANPFDITKNNSGENEVKNNSLFDDTPIKPQSEENFPNKQQVSKPAKNAVDLFSGETTKDIFSTPFNQNIANKNNPPKSNNQANVKLLPSQNVNVKPTAPSTAKITSNTTNIFGNIKSDAAEDLFSKITQHPKVSQVPAKKKEEIFNTNMNMKKAQYEVKLPPSNTITAIQPEPVKEEIPKQEEGEPNEVVNEEPNEVVNEIKETNSNPNPDTIPYGSTSKTESKVKPSFITKLPKQNEYLKEEKEDKSHTLDKNLSDTYQLEKEISHLSNTVAELRLNLMNSNESAFKLEIENFKSIIDHKEKENLLLTKEN